MLLQYPYVILFVMKKVMNGLRVTEEQELMGLDLSEHGSYGYPEVFAKKDPKPVTITNTFSSRSLEE